MGICKQHDAKNPQQENHKRETREPIYKEQTERESEYSRNVRKFTDIGHTIHKMFLDEKKDFVRYYLIREGRTLEDINILIDKNLAEAIRAAKCVAVDDNINERPWR